MTDYCRVVDCGEPGEWCDIHARKHEDAAWNAALEACASDLSVYCATSYDAAEQVFLESAIARIRALKREVK